MDYSQTITVFGLAASRRRRAVALFSRRAPMRGWVGVVLLLVASLAWALIESGESSRPSSLPMFLTFLSVAPVAVVYSFRARRVAPDRVLALAAFRRVVCPCGILAVHRGRYCLLIDWFMRLTLSRSTRREGSNEPTKCDRVRASMLCRVERAPILAQS